MIAAALLRPRWHLSICAGPAGAPWRGAVVRFTADVLPPRRLVAVDDLAALAGVSPAGLGALERRLGWSRSRELPAYSSPDGTRYAPLARAAEWLADVERFCRPLRLSTAGARAVEALARFTADLQDRGAAALGEALER